MSNDNRTDIVPGQDEGASTNSVETVTAPNEDEARKLFVKAKGRLCDVNRWHLLSGAASATFQLADEKGNKLERAPRVGDFICIDIPGPGTSAGNGNDWVRIEAIEDKSAPSSGTESFSIRVRPASNPQSASGETAHFYTSDATSSFVVEREGNKVSAAEHGRNEVPNTAADKVLDKARNITVALGAMAGISKAQWKALVKGLLSDKE